MLQDILHVGHTDDVPGYMVGQAMSIDEVLKHIKVLEPMNEHYQGQQLVVVGTGMKIVKPDRHFISHDGSH